MKKTIIFLFIPLSINLALAAEVYMEISVHITHDEIAATGIELYEGQARDYVLDYDEQYDVKVFSLKNELLKEFTLQKNFYVYDSPIGELDETDEVISIPYYNNIGKMEIWDGDKLMLDLDLSEYATCNQDGICDINENIDTCPEDCRVKVVKEVETPEEEEVPIKEEQKNNFALIIGGIVILAVLIALILIRKNLTKSKV